VKHARNHGRRGIRKLVTALAVGAVGVGVFVPAAAAEPNAQSCQGGIVSSSVQPSAFGPGRRAVATMFFGDAPTAVRDAQRALQEACASQ
jgi:hypothetical protein